MVVFGSIIEFYKEVFKYFLVLQLLVLVPGLAKGQSSPPMVRKVHIRGNFVSDSLQMKIDSIMQVGKQFDPLNLSKAYITLREDLTRPEADIAESSAGAISVLQITSRNKNTSDTAANNEEITVELLPFYLRVDLVNIGNNYFPVPHNPYATFWHDVSPLLRASKTKFGVSSDKRFGPAIQLQTQTNLLQAFSSGNEKEQAKPIQVNLDLDLNKALDRGFNDFAVGLSLDKLGTIGLGNAPGFLFSPTFRHSELPIGDDRYKNDLLTLIGQIHGSSDIMFLSKYALTAGFSFSKNTTFGTTKVSTQEKAYNVGITGDQKIGNGVERIRIYFDSHFPDDQTPTYQRITGNFGYAFILGKGHSNIDVETTLGGGTSFGTLPSYSKFWAGNSSGNFLYESVTFAPSIVTQVQGPLVRSLGQNQGGLGAIDTRLGGTSYWNFNLTISLPIARWSKALIPDIAISETPTRFTLAKALKGQVNTVESAIYDNLVNNEGLPDDESTEAKASAIVDKDIRPAINYLADRANIYSIKPMFLFDIAKLYSGDSTTPSKTWSSAGLGLQLMIVNAKFQAAYIHALTNEPKGFKSNFLLRLIFENLY